MLLLVVFAGLVWHSNATDRKADIGPKPRTDCLGLCPCRVVDEPDEGDLESWELSGRDLFGCCPAWCHFPVDLGPRQWTWRLAEVNLWMQITVAVYNVYSSYVMPPFLLKPLQVSMSVLMFVAAVPILLAVHQRQTGPLLQYFFCSLITQGLYAAAKYSILSSVLTACALNQNEFRGCKPLGPLARCMPINVCTQAQLNEVACPAPGVDTCTYFAPVVNVHPGHRNLFLDDALGVMFFLWGTVPIFMAAIARQSRPAPCT
mmetsp:Transcript_103444/g.316645  ORF Transcript_103444/g.316645 Transcript_103444/m.316645 type:complete len:260 (-) Transcript_103444:44-823(-)